MTEKLHINRSRSFCAKNATMVPLLLQQHFLLMRVFRVAVTHLSKGEEQSHIAVNALLLELLTCTYALPGGRQLQQQVQI